MVVLGTSAVLAAMNEFDPAHRTVVALMAAEPLLILPVSILAETNYMIEQRFGAYKVASFVQSLIDGDVALDWQHGDLRRVHELLTRYADLPLGFADSAVIACAERHGGRVATLDHRHFDVVAREGTIQILP